MQPDNLRPAPGNLEESVLQLARLQGIELPSDYARSITPKPFDVKHLPHLADTRRLYHQRQRIKLEALNDDDYPCLLQMKGKQFYLVLERQGSNFRIMAPDGEQHWLTEQQLQPDYSGIIHQLSRDPAKRSDKERPADSHWLKQQIGRLWPQYLQVLLITLLINLLTLALPIFTHFVFGKVLPGQAMDTMLTISIGMGFVLFLDFVLRWLRSYFLDDACRAITRQAETSLLEKVLTLEKHQLQVSTAKITQVIRDFARIRESISSSVMLSVLDIPFFILFSLAIGWIGGPLVWIPITVATVLIALSLISYRLARAHIAANIRTAHDKNAFLNETIGGLDTIRAMATTPGILARWRVLVAGASSREFQSKQTGALASALVASATQSVVFFMLVVGVLLIRDGLLAPGSLFACIILGSRAIAPMANLSMALNRISQARQSLQEIQQLFTNEASVEKADLPGQPVTTVTGEVVVENLSFCYPGALTPILDSVSFTLKPGERVALLGASGAGKSTLIDLLQGNQQADQGQITVNRFPLNQLNLKDYRRCLGVARQQPILFSGSIRSNLLMGCPGATNEALDRVCTLTGLNKFIRQCPGGYDYPVTEQGNNLSVGQQQAIGLARALLHGGDLLILDEPTSAFDNYHEALFCQQLPGFLKPGQTLLLITHRSSLLQLVDRIIVLADGKIVADGPREEVLATMASHKRTG
ncbi:peptidase domain-containing ABC transporter [Endozoicomonas sp. ONNA2]|uniref:peptidase domain-containing ABC transporter n=1 Tax=Endozoicomonas sp. ONNA2 TaxID=2828741 RepID=UPI0021496046|nr:peptidase domain-containing ABC transporter [Endozoicomonas sp. ONNA2]